MKKNQFIKFTDFLDGLYILFYFTLPENWCPFQCCLKRRRQTYLSGIINVINGMRGEGAFTINEESFCFLQRWIVIHLNVLTKEHTLSNDYCLGYKMV